MMMTALVRLANSQHSTELGDDCLGEKYDDTPEWLLRAERVLHLKAGRISEQQPAIQQGRRRWAKPLQMRVTAGLLLVLAAALLLAARSPGQHLLPPAAHASSNLALLHVPLRQPSSACVGLPVQDYDPPGRNLLRSSTCSADDQTAPAAGQFLALWPAARPAALRKAGVIDALARPTASLPARQQRRQRWRTSIGRGQRGALRKMARRLVRCARPVVLAAAGAAGLGLQRHAWLYRLLGRSPSARVEAAPQAAETWARAHGSARRGFAAAASPSATTAPTVAAAAATAAAPLSGAVPTTPHRPLVSQTRRFAIVLRGWLRGAARTARAALRVSALALRRVACGLARRPLAALAKWPGRINAMRAALRALLLGHALARSWAVALGVGVALAVARRLAVTTPLNPAPHEEAAARLQAGLAMSETDALDMLDGDLALPSRARRGATPPAMRLALLRAAAGGFLPL